MKVLFITHHYLNGTGGGVFASRAYINAFAGLAEEMTLLYPSGPGHEPEGLKTGINMVPVPYDKPRVLKFVDLICGNVSRYGRVALDYVDPDRFDTVVFDTSLVSFRLVERFKRAGIRTICIHHNVQVEYFKSNTGPLLWLPAVFWAGIYEKQAVRSCDLNLTLTDADKEYFLSHYDAAAAVEVLGVFESSESVKAPLADGRAYLVTGTLSDLQTSRSIARWMEHCLPSLMAADPSAQVIIAGRGPSQDFRKLCADAGVELIPSPEDMLPILLRAGCYICPIDCGGGMKLRVMDGLRAGLPVIVHEVSARGYEHMGNVHVYHDEESFLSALAEVRTVSGSSAEMQDEYYRHFSFSSGVERLKAMLDNVPND